MSQELFWARYETANDKFPVCIVYKNVYVDKTLELYEKHCKKAVQFHGRM